MDREAWCAAVYRGVAKSWTWLSELNWTELKSLCSLRLWEFWRVLVRYFVKYPLVWVFLTIIQELWIQGEITTEVRWLFLISFSRGYMVSEKAMAPHSSTLAWKIPWMDEPGRLQSMGSQRVGHDWATWLSLFTFMHWRRKWQPTPVFLPGESQGRGSLVACRLWGRTESDTTEVT